VSTYRGGLFFSNSCGKADALNLWKEMEDGKSGAPSQIIMKARALFERRARAQAELEEQLFKLSDRAGSSTQQVDDQDHKRNHKQQMDQAPRYVQAETQKPQNQKHHKDRPKHIRLLRQDVPFCTSRVPNPEPHCSIPVKLVAIGPLRCCPQTETTN
jgi:hypothetical protein